MKFVVFTTSPHLRQPQRSRARAAIRARKAARPGVGVVIAGQSVAWQQSVGVDAAAIEDAWQAALKLDT